MRYEESGFDDDEWASKFFRDVGRGLVVFTRYDEGEDEITPIQLWEVVPEDDQAGTLKVKLINKIADLKWSSHAER